MAISYDVFTNAFLHKITEYEFRKMAQPVRTETVDEYMKKSVSDFRHICKYDLSNNRDDIAREFDIDIPVGDLEEISDIISEGMVVRWLKPLANKQENYELMLSTKDYTALSSLARDARLAYKQAEKDYTQMKREYSYNHADLTELHI